MKEVDLEAELIADAVDPDANIIFGATIDETLGDEMVITIVATGFDASKQVFNLQDKAETTTFTPSRTQSIGLGSQSASNQSSSVQTTSVNDKPKSTFDDFDLDSGKDVFSPKNKKIEKPQSASVEDPSKDLEVPAFLRRNK